VTGSSNSYDHLRVFGRKAFVKSKKCMFIGYEKGHLKF